jgi:aspartate/methionine/tyrosine aminotransferase
MSFSENVRQVEGSATIAIAARARELRAQGRNVLDLSIGEPDFRTPEFAAQAGSAAIQEGHTHYPPVPGIAPLRDAIARLIQRTTGTKAEAAGVVVTSGAKQALFNACFCLFGPGDEVLIPVPYWTSYPALVRLARAEPRFVPTTAEGGFRATVESIEAARTPRVKGLILNSPSNPTGAVYSEDELAAIARWARQNDIWLISDEIYGRICFTAPRAPSVLDVVDSLEQIVIVDGASKAYAMTGWRLGYSYSTRTVAERMSALQSQITSGASTPAQYAALAAFSDVAQGEKAVREMTDVFTKRRNDVQAEFREHAPDVYCFPPDGAFYLFFQVDQFYTASVPDSSAFCSWVLEETDVALVPGSAFGEDRFVRMSFATSSDILSEAIKRLGHLLQPAGVRG